MTEEQQVKISDITNYLTGKASSSFTNKAESKPSSDDFSFEENFSNNPAPAASVSTEEDDFFSDL